MDEKTEKLNKLAHDVLILSRNTLLVNMRFMDMALSRFKYIPIEESTLLTDGENILYNPVHVLKCYKCEKESPTRDYLHIVMHCIFRHMYMDPTLNRVYWDLACDIAVENIICELGLKAVATQKQKKEQEYLDKLKIYVNQITAEKVYHYLMKNLPDEKDAAELRGLFYSDNHEIWYMTKDEIIATFGIVDNKKETKNSSTEKQNENTTLAEYSRSDVSEMIRTWKDISESMLTDLETFSKEQGNIAGSLTQNLQAVNREKYDYTEFLKKFAVMGEAMKINEDEFDYVFYTYGLQLYENMPLIEPLEYKEVKRIKEFVIAIDTSGSVEGEIVQKFIQKTYNILKSTESFFEKINVHIIQCDAEIQEDFKITSQEEFDEYIKTMKIKGLGGTDFRPVFSYVDQLIDKKEFTNLKGLIYFTDGYGEFPNIIPDYETAFIFLDDDNTNQDIPHWAIKLVLHSDEI